MSRSLNILLGGVALLALAPTLAQAQDQGSYTTDGSYVGGAVGYNWFRNVSPHGANADVSGGLNGDIVGLGTVGYGFGDGLRLELEGGYRQGEFTHVRGSNEAGGQLQTYSAMVNGLYDFNPADFGLGNLPLYPHLGVGVGWAHPHFDHAYAFNGATLVGVDDVFAYQGIAGVEYPLMPQLKVGVDYHFFGTENGTFTNASNGRAFHTSLQDHSVLLNVRWEFGVPQAPAAPPPPPPTYTPPPAPPAVKPEAQRSFQVFFDFDKSDITSAASNVIRQAAESVREGNLTRITVTGHTDTVGSARYNQALSERRAAAVKRELVTDGVGQDGITTLGVGKTGLLVPTADGVREPQNRRAEIVLQ